MDYKIMFPGRFLAAVEFKGQEITGQIEGVKIEVLEGDKGKENKGIITLAGFKKRWVLNRTNAECLVAMFGRDTDQWIGHWVTLYPAIIDDQPAIRVKGSPELAEPKAFELKLPRKKARMVRMMPTNKGEKRAVMPPQSEAEAA